MSRITTNETVGRTFFVVIHEESLKNMLIEPQWDNIEQFEKTLISSFSDVLGHDNFYGTICESAQGIKHIHLVETENKPKRFTAVAKKLGNAHTEQMRGTKEQAEDYIEKRGKFEEKGEKILGYFGNKNAIQNNSGKRTDLDIEKQIRDGTLNASNLNRYILDNTTTDTQAKRIENRYARILHDIYDKTKRENIEVIYVEGKTGEGKTYNAIEKYPDYFIASVDEHNNFAFDNYKGEKTLILDELRPGIFKANELLRILDKYPLLLNVKYGNFPACWERIIITTAYPLKEWYNDETVKGNDDKKAQFLRRINKYYIAKNREWIDQHYKYDNTTKKATWDANPEWLNCDTTDIPFLTE